MEWNGDSGRDDGLGSANNEAVQHSQLGDVWSCTVVGDPTFFCCLAAPMDTPRKLALQPGGKERYLRRSSAGCWNRNFIYVYFSIFVCVCLYSIYCICWPWIPLLPAYDVDAGGLNQIKHPSMQDINGLTVNSLVAASRIWLISVGSTEIRRLLPPSK